MDDLSSQDLPCFHKTVEESSDEPLFDPEGIIQPSIAEEFNNISFTDIDFSPVSSPVPSLTTEKLSSQDIRFLDSPSNLPMFDNYTAEQLYGSSSITFPNIETAVQPSTPNFPNSSSTSELCMDNVLSQDLRFLDHPMDTSQRNIDFNGYTAEQLYDDDSISFPLVEPTLVPAVIEDSNDAANHDNGLESQVSQALHYHMIGAGLNTPKDAFKCNACERVFSRNYDLKRHMQSLHENERFQCDVCEKYFARKDNLLRHKKNHKKSSQKRIVESEQTIQSKKIKSHDTPIIQSRSAELPVNLKQTEQAFNGIMQTFQLRNEEGFRDIKSFLNHLKPQVISKLTDLVSKQQEFKINFRLFCIYEKGVEDNLLRETKFFKTRNETILQSIGLSEIYDKASEKLQKEATDFEQKESGWKLVEILYLELRINRYNPLKASSHIPLPPAIQRKHAVVNVKNEDNMCFKWAVLSALYPADNHVDRVRNYTPYENTLNFQDISFPVKIKDIPKFEKLNGIGINIFYLNAKYQICPMRICNNPYQCVIDLIYLKKNEVCHYAWIKDLSRLLSSQVSKNKSKKYFCRRCLTAFGSEALLSKHQILCSDHDVALVKMPTKEHNIVKFRNTKHQQQIPFVIVADFEAVTKKIDTCEPNSNSSYSMSYQKHEAVCFSYFIIYQFGLYKPPVVYRGENAPSKFMEMLAEEAKEIETIYQTPKPMAKLTDKEENDHQKSFTCYICNGKFSKKNGKVKDHCHLTGMYRGTACNNCNLQFRLPHFIPVFFS